MPRFTKLSEERVHELERRVPKIDLGQYENFLKSLTPGQWGGIEPEGAESSKLLKRRLTTAAKSMGFDIKYRRSEDNSVLFKLEGTQGGSTENPILTAKRKVRDNKVGTGT